MIGTFHGRDATRQGSKKLKASKWAVAVALVGLSLWCGACHRPPPAAIAGMVRLPGGTFTMGCVAGDKRCRDEEKPAHRVTLTPFYLDEHPVTVVEYRPCVAAKICKPAQLDENEWWRNYDNLDRADRADHPANGVDWDDASAYCRWAGKRLPTEAEFEYALRGGRDGQIYAGGDAAAPGNGGPSKPAKPRTNLPASPSEPGWEGTAPVCAAGRNAFGLCDMEGNVWEWCADWFGAHYYAASPRRNPQGPPTGEDHVLRGSTQYAFPELRRASYREFSDHDFVAFYVGFRCARD